MIDSEYQTIPPAAIHRNPRAIIPTNAIVVISLLRVMNHKITAIPNPKTRKIQINPMSV